MSVGRAVLATRGNWLGDLIKEGINGLLFTPGDSVELASKLEYLLRDSSRIKSLGNLAREEILKNYNFRKIMRKKMSFILKVLQNNPVR